MQYAAVTSFGQEGFDKYGQQMIETFLKNGPADTQLLVFSDEGLVHNIADNRVRFFSLLEHLPEQFQFEVRHQSPICHGIFGKSYDYRFDAIKFSHKPAAICAATRILHRENKTDVLIWFDGDIIFKKPLTKEFLEEKLPRWTHVGHFSRAGNHTEAGVLMFRISDKNVRAFIEIAWKTYESDQVFRLPAWTDCHVFDILAHGAKEDGFLRVENLGDDVSHNTNHPIVNSDWFPYLDHLKGNRKTLGESYSEDIVAPPNRIEISLQKDQA